MAHGRCRICDDPMTRVDREAMEERNREECKQLGARYDKDDFDEQEPICMRCQEEEDGKAYDAKQERDLADGGDGAVLLERMREARRLK